MRTVVQWRLAVALMLGPGWVACSSDDPSTGATFNPIQRDAGDGVPQRGIEAGVLDGATHDAAAASDAGPVVYTVDAALGSSGSDAAMASCAARNVEAEVTRLVQPADIVIAIDSSGSMDEEIEFVQMQMNAFSQQIVASGIDVHVILIGEAGAICIAAPLGSGMCPADTKLPGYLHVDREVGSRDGLNVILNSYAQWSGQLRADASKSFVIITDDEASQAPNNSAAAFTSNLRALDAAMFAKWTFNGIFVLEECALGERVGQVYKDLVSQTGGVSGDLCLQDFKPVFDRLSRQIITTSMSELACEWDIPEPPPGEKLDFGSVNVRYADKAGVEMSLGKVPSQAECPNFKNGWYYDDAQNPTKIFACPQSCTQMRTSGVSKVEVLLGCKSEPPPPALE